MEYTLRCNIFKGPFYNFICLKISFLIYLNLNVIDESSFTRKRYL